MKQYTLHAPGSFVWIMYNNEPKQVRIREVQLTDSNNPILYRPNVFKVTLLRPNKVFSTKEELIKSL